VNDLILLDLLIDLVPNYSCAKRPERRDR